MQGKPSRSFGELLVLLLQFIEQRTGKELTKRDIKTITELFNGGDQEPLLLSRQGNGRKDQFCRREPIGGHAEKMR